MPQVHRVRVPVERGKSSSPRRRKRTLSSPSDGSVPIGSFGAVDRELLLRTTAEQHARLEADRVARNRFVPPCVLINAAFQVVHFSSNARRFFKIASGRPTFDLFRIAHPDLISPLRSALRKSISKKANARIEKVLFQSRRISLEVIPLKNLGEPFFLILFDGLPETVSEGSGGDRDNGILRRQNRSLTQELNDTRDYLRASEERNGAAMDELQSSTEEVTTANEELLTLNEELETSKEELRASIEELARANADLERKVLDRTRELEQANVRLRELSGRLLHAQENERARIARELHDEIGQSLTAMNLVTNQFQSDETNEPVKNLREIIKEVMHRIRTLSYELHPPILDSLGLHAALKWHFITFRERTKIKVIFRGATNPEPSLTSEAKITLFRIAQETLNNVAKHASTSTVHARIYPRNNFIHFTISDSGKGFSIEQAKQNPSLGLAGMKERLSLIGGTFHIESKSGLGTRIHVSVPQASQAPASLSKINGGHAL